MKDDDWDAMLETVDALFCIVAEQVADQAESQTTREWPRRRTVARRQSD